MIKELQWYEANEQSPPLGVELLVRRGYNHSYYRMVTFGWFDEYKDVIEWMYLSDEFKKRNPCIYSRLTDFD